MIYNIFHKLSFKLNASKIRTPRNRFGQKVNIENISQKDIVVKKKLNC